MTGWKWINLGPLWTRLETEDRDTVVLRLDERSLKESGTTYDQALETLEAAKEAGTPLTNSARAGDAHQVLAIKADKDRSVIRIKARWVRTP